MAGIARTPIQDSRTKAAIGDDAGEACQHGRDPATWLRDADNVQAPRIALMERAKKEFLDYEVSYLEDVECRLRHWLAQVEMAANMK